MSATVLEPGSSNISRIEQLSHEIIQLIIADKQQLDIKDRKLLEKKAVYEKELSSVLDDERSKLQEYENQFIEAKSQLEYNQSKFTQTVHTTKIKLDIGGKTFSTSKTSLSYVPGSFFSSIIEGKVSAEEDGSFFIDRDPTVFHLILNFLRGYPLQRDLLSTAEYELLVSDAEYYQLPSLVQYLNSPTSSLDQIGTALSPLPVFKAPIQSGNFRWAEGANYTVTPDGSTIISQANGSWNATAISNAPFPNSGIIEFCVQIKSTQNSHIMIGVAPPSIDRNVSGNFSQGVGYYLYCARGTLYSKEGVKLDSPYFSNTTIAAGDIVKTVINFDLFTIAFAVNGVDYGYAYSFPRNIDLVPVVIFYDPTDSVTKI